MSMIDMFRGDAFSVVSLTDAINKVPRVPGRLGSLGLFRESGITTTTVSIEEKDGQLSLISATPRGGPGTTLGNAKRTLRAFTVPHLQRESTILADQVQGVRAFGSEDATLGVQSVINDRMAELRPMHDATLEWMRVGALKGLILDADGATVLYNLFDQFGVSQQVVPVDMDMSVDDDLRNVIVGAVRLVERELGADTVSSYRAFCGDDFFDAFIASAPVKESLKYQESQLLRTDLRSGFAYGGVTWENYSGRVGDQDFIQADEAYLAPIGTQSLFRTYFAPADFLETVNTVGLPLYAKVAVDEKFQRYAELHTQSNPLALCLRPRAVVKLVIAGS